MSASSRQVGRARSTEGSSEQTLGLDSKGPWVVLGQISRQTALHRHPLGTPDIDVLGSVPAKGDPSKEAGLVPSNPPVSLGLSALPQGYFSLLSICIAGWREMNYIPPGFSVPYN